MQSYLQRGKSGEQAAWLRLIASICILMVTFMSAAQACHTHAETSSLRQGSHQNQPSPEDHCLVCVAMHTAIPAPAHALQETTVDATQYVVPSQAVEKAQYDSCVRSADQTSSSSVAGFVLCGQLSPLSFEGSQNRQPLRSATQGGQVKFRRPFPIQEF